MEQIYSYAIRKIHEQIPYEILRETFDLQKTLGYGLRTPINLDSTIESKIIRGSVLKDVQAVGGRESTIPLGGVKVQLLETNKVVVQIPLSLTGGRNIMDVYRINYFTGYGGSGYSYQGQSTFNLALNNILDSVTPPPITSTSRCEMITPNTLLIDLDGTIPAWMEAEVLLEDDSELSNISSASYPLFSELCVARCKAHIYKELRIRMDEGRVEGGQVIGEFKNIIDQWSDVEQTYKDLMKRFRTTMRIEDRSEYEKLIRLSVGRVHL